MISKWNDFKLRILKFLKIYKEKDYLEKLVQNLEYCQRENKYLSFIITSQKQRGFVVKVAGLYAFISFNHMPWKYKNIEYWDTISKYLIGEKFYCNIYQIKKDPLFILINAENHRFDKLKLIENSQIEGAILAKARYGIFVEIGSYFNWRYGSIVCLLHKSNIYNFKLKSNLETGEKIPLFFYGYDIKNENRIILGDTYLPKEWFTGELDKLVGTNQKVKVIINEIGKREYYVKDKFRASLPISILIYPEYSILKIQKILLGINHNQTINCKIIEVNYNSRKIILKLNLKIEKNISTLSKYKLGNLLTDKMKGQLNKLDGN